VSVLGKLVANYCPSVTGCRAVVEFKDATDMKTIEITDDQLRLAFNSSHGDVWLVCIIYLLSIFCVIVPGFKFVFVVFGIT